MATFMYDKGREGFLDGSIDFDTDDIRFVLVKSGYVADQATHDNLNDVTSGERIVTSTALTGKTKTDGVADASDHTLSAVPAGSTGVALVLYKHTGTESTSRLIAYIDNYTGLPVSTNGGDIIVQWPSDANKIFRL